MGRNNRKLANRHHPGAARKAQKFPANRRFVELPAPPADLRIANNAPPKNNSKELCVSIGELAAVVLPGVDLAANKWRFHHLIWVLDIHVLKLLTRGDDSDLLASFSINVNIGTILAPDFLDFDSQLRVGSHGTIIVELQPADVFGDLVEFAFMRDFLHEKGYRICLDGITPAALPFIDRATLGVDLIKVFWNADLASADSENGSHNPATKAIERIGPARIVLAHCDSSDAIRFGQSVGLTMYQDRAIDGMLKAQRR